MKKIVTGVGFLGILLSTVSVSFAAYFNANPIARCETQITRTLRIGSENNEVFVLQQMLDRAGYLQASPNGYFGYQTSQAVKAFQSDNGISRTGSVGEATRNAINERLCDTDLTANQYNEYEYSSYGYQGATTYVGSVDPYVKVVTPSVTNPTVYSTPQNIAGVVVNPVTVTTPSTTLSPSFSDGVFGYTPTPFGYTNQRPNYNPEPSGSLTVTSPVANSVYREGDIVSVVWSTNNLTTNAPYSILLENTVGGQSKTVGIAQGSPFSFTLTKELLDAVCVGTCTESQQLSFRIVIAAPTTTYSGETTLFRAAVAPITIKRPTTFNGKVTLSSSKTEVNSGESFKLFVNFPSTQWDTTLAANYTIKVKAICNPSTTVTVGGVTCGGEYTLPQQGSVSQYQQEISSTIVNALYQKQMITYQVMIVNILGQVVGISETKVTVNSAPLGW